MQPGACTIGQDAVLGGAEIVGEDDLHVGAMTGGRSKGAPEAKLGWRPSFRAAQTPSRSGSRTSATGGLRLGNRRDLDRLWLGCFHDSPGIATPSGATVAGL